MKLNEIFTLETGNETFADRCEKIADNYAIEFARWFHSNYKNEGIQLYSKFGKWELVTISKALETFKKQKAL